LNVASSGAADIAVIGRTRWALNAVRQLLARDMRIGVVATFRAEPFYGCDTGDFAELATDAKALFIDATQLSTSAFFQSLKQVPCKIALSVNWPRVLDAQAVSLFPLGVLNAHAGDLPRYRGNACPNWAILNGENDVGLCVHLMEGGKLDSGPIVLRERFALGAETEIAEVYGWLDEAVPRLLSDAAIGLLNSQLTPVPQPLNPELSLRCYPRRPEDGRIDWRQPAAFVHRLIRASGRPFEGAFAFLEDGRRLTIWRASLFAHTGPFSAVPGQIMLRDNGLPVVACGEGCIALTEVEISGLDSKDAIKAVGSSLRGRLA
jgi:methionyl-tRNA formyltransferase